MIPLCLLTRPQDQADRFAAQLHAARPDLRVVIAPMQQMVAVPHDAAVIEAAPGVVFTSPNGVRFAPPGRGRPALCVGPGTAQAAMAAGWDATEGPGDAERMLPMLVGLDGYVHVHGHHRARELPLRSVMVYRQQALPLSDAGVAALTGDAPVIVPLFSPRSARLLGQAVAVLGGLAALHPVAISDNAAAQWDATGAPPVAVTVRQPNADDMAAAILHLADSLLDRA